MTRQITEALHLQALPPSVKNTLDSWRFWFSILAVAVAGLFIWAIVNTNQIAQAQARQTRDDTIKAAQTQAQAQATYQACFQARPELARASLHVRGVNELAETLVMNNAALLKATPRTDPQYPTRLANLVRLEHAARKIAAVKSFPVPTAADCSARRTAVLNLGH